MEKMERTLTDEMNKLFFKETMDAYRKGCHFVLEVIFQSKILTQAKLQKTTDQDLRSPFSLRSQWCNLSSKQSLLNIDPQKAMIILGH